MVTSVGKVLAVLSAMFLLAGLSLGQAPSDIKAKFDAKVQKLEVFSADPQVVKAVKAYNSATPSEEAASMTNEKWHTLTVFDPLVRSVLKTPLSDYLRSKKDDTVIKIFVSGADGGKAGFDAKTEHWTHKGMAKHEVPMTGKMWVGPVKLDDSTGQQMIQVGFPVMDSSKPIGSIVFGMRTDKLR
jgi:hypothetical protein